MRLRRLTTATVALLVLVSMAMASAQGLGSRVPHLVVREAEEALQARRYTEALALFSEAASLLRSDPSVCVGAAVAASLGGQLEDAEVWFRRALGLRPNYTRASLLLGQLLYRQGRLSEAVRVYEDASQYARDEPQLAERLERWRAETELHSRFFEARSAHFAVLFDGPANDLLARNVVVMLEDAYSRIAYALSTYPNTSITVVLYTQQQFRDLTHAPSWAGGAYDGRIKLPAAGLQEPDDTVRRVLEHELVHALVSSVAVSSVPIWLHEGLATMLEPGGLEWTSGVLERTPERLPMARLNAAFASLDTDNAALAYAQSASAVKRIVELRGMPALVALIQALGQGTPLEVAFQKTLQMRLDEFESFALR